MCPTKEALLELITKIGFLKLSEDKETVSYNLDENLAIYLIKNVPFGMKKCDVIKKFEISDQKYNRLYNQSIYWILESTDKDAHLNIKNSLRELYIQDIKVKFDILTKSVIIKNLKTLVEKNLYKKEAKNLGIGSPRDKDRRKNSESSNNSNNFSWRKGSDGAYDPKNSFDSSGRNYYNRNKKKGYYNRNRFNSDSGNPSTNNNNNYRNKNSIGEREREEIEIDVSSLKYSLNIKYKYSFKQMKNFLESLQKTDAFKEPPKFLSSEIDEIILKEKVKDITVFDSLINVFDKGEEEQNKNNTGEKNNNQQQFGNKPLKPGFPKMNPLSSLPKMFNKFDMVAGNIPQYGDNNKDK